MWIMEAVKDKVKQIYSALPQLNCGLCGFEGCWQFAKAVAESKASPFGCRRNPWSGHNIGEIMGIKAPVFDYYPIFDQPHFPQRLNPHISLRSLRAEVSELSNRIEGMLDKIDSLGRNMGKGNRKTNKKGGD